MVSENRRPIKKLEEIIFPTPKNVYKKVSFSRSLIFNDENLNSELVVSTIDVMITAF